MADYNGVATRHSIPNILNNSINLVASTEGSARTVSKTVMERSRPPSSHMPIAICGMGMRLPGGIRNDADLFKFLAERRDARMAVPSSRYNIGAYHSEHAKPGTIVSNHGYFLDDIDLAKCDLSMFSMTPAEATRLDPNQRLLLEVVYEAFESAGEADFRGKAIGTFASVFSEDWQDMQNRDVNDAGHYQLTGKADFMLANRISYEYDLTGPSVTLKSACSSSGMALHQAIQAIRLGEISSAIVGGANLILAPGLNIVMSATMALSPTGSCKSFDASADGYARAEGVTCIYIKRLEHALRDGNPIRAIIRGSASNSDGKTAGLSVPNPAAQEALIRQAYRSSGLDFADTPVVECHGTGTKTGDPLELSAISSCFGAQDTYIGSVKPNLGHNESVSAITSILKAVVALENQTVLPNIKFVNPNPAIPWETNKLIVPTELMQWPQGRLERISINTFGFGGSNAHFILESAASFGIPSPKSSIISQAYGGAAPPTRRHLLLFSANTKEALKITVARHHEYLGKYPAHLESAAYTLAQRRERLKYRTFSVLGGCSSMTEQRGPVRPVMAARRLKNTKVAFIFTGQGAQWPMMGRELIQYHAFSDAIDKMDAELRSLEHAPAWSIRDILQNNNDKETMDKVEYSQPICTALQVALVDLLAACGVAPAAVAGHSSGEIGAAYAAGSLSLREAIVLAFYRGFVCRTAQRAGGMAAVGLGRGQVEPYLVPGVHIACENSASSITLSGDAEPLKECLATIKSVHPDILARRLPVSMAYHSHHMQEYGQDYYNMIKPYLQAKDPAIPFFSSVGQTLPTNTNKIREAAYWQDNLENPVMFYSAVKRMMHEATDVSVHLEIGPHSTLAGPLRQIYKTQGASIDYQSCLTRGEDGEATFLHALGQIYCTGTPISLPVHGDNQVESQAKGQVASSLPTYPWQYGEDYWSETRVMTSWRFRQHPHHDLLGLRIVENGGLDPTWRNILRVSDVPWLREHCVNKDTVFPAAAYIAMAGEAVHQLKSNFDGETAPYTVREVHIMKAMLLREDESIEIITSLRPSMLTAKLDSQWYEFSITSFDGREWTRHCRGHIIDGFSHMVKPKMPDMKVLPRNVSSDRWYRTMSRVGLNYGPRFRGMQDISAAVSGGIATARILDSQPIGESRYALHPTTLDCVLQSWTVAQADGIPRQLKGLCLPTFIDKLYVGNLASSATMDIMTVGDDAKASSIGIAGGEATLVLKGLEGSTVANTDSKRSTKMSLQYLEWKPDINFSDISSLLKPKSGIEAKLVAVERLYILCAAEASQQLAPVTVSQPHFTQFLRWLEQQVKLFNRPNYPLVDNARSLLHSSSDSRREMIQECLKEAMDKGAQPLAEAVWRAYSHLSDVLQGHVDYLDLLLKDNLLQKAYDWITDCMDVRSFFSLLGNTHPQLKIIEIGAGTGGLTWQVLDSLRSDYGERLFLKYTYTDVSSGFFVQAQIRFQEYDGIEYRVLDISRDPGEQGFVHGQYDLVLASNVLHATPDLTQTLRNCRKLLKPDGRLFIQELSPVAKSVNFIMGLFAGWWLGEKDGRQNEPYITPAAWDARLRESGFSGAESVTLDGPETCYMNANILARPGVDIIYPRSVTLLTRSASLDSLAQAVKAVLELQEYTVTHSTWADGVSLIGQDIISFIDIEGQDSPILHEVTDGDLDRLLNLIDANSQSTMLWLTKSAQITCQDPRNAQILGLARTIRTELAADFATLELAHTSDAAAAATVDVLQRVQRAKEQAKTATADELVGADMEYVWVDGTIHISRVHWASALQSYKEATGPIVPDAKRLVIGKRGMLETLQWRAEYFGELGQDEVRVRMVNMGLNFRDLMIALDVVAEVAEDPEGGVNLFGAEGTGYITEVGSNVRDLEVGDRVMNFGSTSRGFATTVQRPSACCVRIPPTLADNEAATMAAVYFTALYCLIDKANLQRGQAVLIHSAAGGVGIAAIHVARWLGAEIYATVGSEDKVEFLVREMGIPRTSIFSSRNDGFLHGVMSITNERGVNVVLNSLSGELLHASWKCVAANGCMVEIGKRDVTGYAKLSMSPFNPNRTFACVDVAQLAKDPAIASRMLRKIVELYIDGHIHPIRPITQFKADEVESALRFMQKARHMGKIVITFPEPDVLPITTPRMPAPSFRDDVSYLLVGGLGGLGQAVASWMVSHGARSLIFLSRSAGQSTQHHQFFHELRDAGCAIQCYAGDVADETTVRTVVEDARLPIVGVMHMAMVLCDMGALDMDVETWCRAMRPKINGTWNLHRHLPTALDFFVLFSSIAGLLGYFGQANYASANTFLDAFVQYRHGLGLPASVMNIGPMDEVGYVMQTPSTHIKMMAHSNLTGEQEFLELLQLAIISSRFGVGDKPCDRDSDGQSSYRNRAQLINVPGCKLSIADPRNNTFWKRDPRMAIYRNLEQTSEGSRGGATGDALRVLIASVQEDASTLQRKEACETLTAVIVGCVAGLVMKSDEEIDASHSLVAAGVDSLVAIELRNWWRQRLGIDVTVLELLNGGSFIQLAQLAIVQLGRKYGQRIGSDG